MLSRRLISIPDDGPSTTGDGNGHFFSRAEKITHQDQLDELQEQYISHYARNSAVQLLGRRAG